MYIYIYVIRYIYTYVTPVFWYLLIHFEKYHAMLFITHLHPLGRAAMRARPISLVLPDEAVGIEPSSTMGFNQC